MSEQKPKTVSEIKELLEKENAKREFTFEQKAALQHSIAYAKLSAEDSRKLVNELMKIENMTEVLAVKIVDMMPEHPDDVRVILAKERFQQDPKNIELILGAVGKYI